MHPSPAPIARRTSALAALVVALTLGLAGCTAHGSAEAGTTGTSGSSAAAGAGGGSSGGGASGGQGTGAQGSANGGTKGDGPGDAPQPVPTPSDASESIPTATPTPYRLPGLPASTNPATKPLVSGTLPKDASAHGRLVRGFPTKAVPVPSGLTVVSSSVSSQGRHLQITLQASTAASPATVHQRFVTALDKVGYTATKAAAVPGTSATQFTHGDDGVVLTTHKRLGGGTELTLTGSFTAG